MHIRKANSNDDKDTILKLMYDTDEYIYPVLMQENKDYTYLLQEKGMYNYENITVAIVDGRIAGLLISFTSDVLIPKIDNPDLQEYFNGLPETLDAQSEYINNVSVCTKFRGMGIATKLINFIEEHTAMPKLALDCLVDNKGALSLYEKLGFMQKAIHPAFCLDKEKDVKDVRMEKVLQR